jgi:hypothetical protein
MEKYRGGAKYADREEAGGDFKVPTLILGL